MCATITARRSGGCTIVPPRAGTPTSSGWRTRFPSSRAGSASSEPTWRSTGAAARALRGSLP
eukprot:8701060-Alexandrium_andersonii.AAC.1